jgi:glycosyltransferase involved in cell wall biosynthesis
VTTDEPRVESPESRAPGGARDRIRVVYVAHTFAVGGAEEMVLNLVRHLPRRFKPLVCCINSAGPIGEEIRSTGTPVAVLGLTPGLRHPWHVGGVRRYMRDVRPAIVHTFLLTASLYGRLAAMLEHVPIVIGTEVNIYERKRPHHIVAERLLMKRTDRVIVSARSVRDFYVAQVHADPAKIDVIYNAVDWSVLQHAESPGTRERVRASLGLGADMPVAGVIARLTEQKGHRFLFEALAAPPLAGVRLLVVGDGELREPLRAEAERLGIADRVMFLGARRDLGDLLAALDVFVMPSLWEGLPLSLILAMGAALPVVATAVAGMPEVVTPGETGWLVPPADASALSRALGEAFGDGAGAAAIGKAAREWVRPRFGVDEYVNSVVSLYDQLLAERSMVASVGGVRLQPDEDVHSPS